MSRRWNSASKTLRDYMAPFVIVWIVFLIILNYLFSWWWEEQQNNTLNTSLSIEVSDWWKWILTLSNWDKKDVLKWEDIKLSKWEKLSVVEWNIITKDNLWNVFNLSKLWELRYASEWTKYVLFSADLWVQSKTDLSLDMRYATVSSKTNSVFNLSQNEVASTVYVVDGTVEVKTLAWKIVVLWKWEKISIMRTNTNDSTFDAESQKWQIDDYIKTDSWFLANWWDKILSSSISSQTSSWELSLIWSWETMSWNTLSDISSNESIYFDNLTDEMILKESKLDITWKIQNENVYKIDINWQIASINNDTKTFEVSLKLSSKVEDIVYKVYDDWLRVLQKWVITVYYDWWTEVKETTTTNTSTLANVKNISISKSPLYTIISPSKNPYNTTENLVKIEWNVPPKTVAKIFVNDFQLKKFPSYWTYWYYFANTDYDNLKPWINMYEIKYFSWDDKLLYTNTVVIVKEESKENTSSWNTVSDDKKEENISSESVSIDTQESTQTWETTQIQTWE